MLIFRELKLKFLTYLLKLASMGPPITLPQVQIRTRVHSIDILRGVIMVIMALDHARDFLCITGFYSNPADLNTTTPALFFTRWITHYCAPTFVFLSGASAFLFGQKRTKQDLRFFLLTRGLWLVFLEWTVVNFGLWFDLTFSLILLQVIWAMGVGMIILACLINLPQRFVLALGLLITIGHNLLDSVQFAPGTTSHIIWTLLHQVSPIQISSNLLIIAGYPILPWAGIMLLGYSFGQLYRTGFDAQKRKRLLAQIGLAAIASFILIRLLNVYGDPAPWAPQKTGLWTFLSFINTTKYPPSLAFTLMTLGPGILFLSWLEGQRPRWSGFFRVYGKVPLFYYILHFYLIHSLAVILLLLNGVAWSDINFQNKMGGLLPNKGLTLGQTYLAWLLIVLTLYPLCRWYGNFKSKQTNPLWSYL